MERIGAFPLRERLRPKNWSLRLTLVLLTVAATAVVLVLLPVVGRMFNQLQETIFSRYGEPVEIAPGFYVRHFDDSQLDSMTELDSNLLAFYGIAEPVVTAALPVTAVLAVSFGFYRLKLKRPLAELEAGAARIASNDLDFRVEYAARDEMGRLCGAFEAMRAQLLDNYRATWRTMEERRQTNAAFAHDLRTPLTVLKGYTDLLCAYVPSGRLSQEKLLSTVRSMSDSVARLSDYVQTMSEIQRLEDVVPVPERTDARELAERLHGSAAALAKAAGKSCVFEAKLRGETVTADGKQLFRVLENLVSNGLRYAMEGITVTFAGEAGSLTLQVTDDGPGFAPEALEHGTEPFYHGKTPAEGSMGLGLHICKLLCERCGGGLTLENRPGAGARATASFLFEPPSNGVH